MISGGGTGGHIYPAIAIAHAWKEKYPASEILFVGALGKMEMQKVPEAGYKIKGLPVAGLQRSLSLENLKFPFKLLKSLTQASKIITDFNPDAVVGVGGYASGPVLYAAQRKGIPTLVQEQKLEEEGYQVLWQCGKFYFQEMKTKLADSGLATIHLKEFIREMDLAYAAADVIVSRAGALSVSELSLVGKPVIFIPSPNVAEDHQTKNAMAYVSHNAALLLNDSEAVGALEQEVTKLMKDSALSEVLGKNIKNLAKPNAAIAIVEEVEQLIA